MIFVHFPIFMISLSLISPGVELVNEMKLLSTIRINSCQE
jgi:hypothetical protein